MKINWKYVAQTKGYKSLKLAYIKDARRPHYCLRKKEELLITFNWIICRAKYHAQYENVSIDTILDRWETERKLWWLSHYTKYAARTKKHTSSVLYSIGIKGKIKRNNSSIYYKNDPIARKHSNCAIIVHKQKQNSTKKKPRWLVKRKNRIK